MKTERNDGFRGCVAWLSEGLLLFLLCPQNSWPRHLRCHASSPQFLHRASPDIGIRCKLIDLWELYNGVNGWRPNPQFNTPQLNAAMPHIPPECPFNRSPVVMFELSEASISGTHNTFISLCLLHLFLICFLCKSFSPQHMSNIGVVKCMENPLFPKWLISAEKWTLRGKRGERALRDGEIIGRWGSKRERETERTPGQEEVEPRVTKKKVWVCFQCRVLKADYHIFLGLWPYRRVADWLQHQTILTLFPPSRMS